MPNNYGLGTREMGKAGTFAANAAARAGNLSYASAATIGERWQRFNSWARAEQGIKRMEQVGRQAVEAYGRNLAEQVESGRLSAAYAQNLVSAVNTVMDLATHGRWEAVAPTRTCGIAKRSSVRTVAPTGSDRVECRSAINALRDSGLERQAAIAGLARELGLRSKEASLLNARAALAEAAERGRVTISEGTKGGRVREVPIATPGALEALRTASKVQGEMRNLIPEQESWRKWREGGLRDGREALQALGIARYHDLRAAYACERYEALTGHPAPVLGGSIADRAKDRDARLRISAELGHGRIEVVAAYIGGR